ncbi:MAG: T9SS type A sorting domain-containing protein [Bacteroidia bacterium]|nr:T9SS type A sorting domain-containing protein [Bacteroidia bacterium]
MKTKNQLNRPSFFALLLVFFAGIFQPAQATVYQTVANGNWSDNSTWMTVIPPKTLQMADTLVIEHNITFNSNSVHWNYGKIIISGNLNGSGFPVQVYNMANLEVTSSGSLSVCNIVNGYSGAITINGTLLMSGGLNNQGMFENSGYSFFNGSPFGLYNAGYAINNSLMETGGGICNAGFLDNAQGAIIRIQGLFSGSVNSGMSNEGHMAVARTFSTEGTQVGCGTLTICYDFYAGKSASWLACQQVCAGGKRLDCTGKVVFNCSTPLSQQCPVIITPPAIGSSKTDFGTPGEPESAKISVYPNPCSGNQLNIRLESLTEPATLSLLDLQGRKIVDQQIDPDQVSDVNFNLPAGLTPGLYLVRMESVQGIVTEKVLLQ